MARKGKEFDTRRGSKEREREVSREPKLWPESTELLYSIGRITIVAVELKPIEETSLVSNNETDKIRTSLFI